MSQAACDIIINDAETRAAVAHALACAQAVEAGAMEIDEPKLEEVRRALKAARAAVADNLPQP